MVGRTNIDIDDRLLGRAMRRFGCRTKREAVHLALERLVGGELMTVEEQLATRGLGWDGDLAEMRADRALDDTDWEAEDSGAPG